jgi:hypothetical protein
MPNVKGASLRHFNCERLILLRVGNWLLWECNVLLKRRAYASVVLRNTTGSGNTRDHRRLANSSPIGVVNY